MKQKQWDGGGLRETEGWSKESMGLVARTGDHAQRPAASLSASDSSGVQADCSGTRVEVHTAGKTDTGTALFYSTLPLTLTTGAIASSTSSIPLGTTLMAGSGSGTIATSTSSIPEAATTQTTGSGSGTIATST